MGEPKAPEPSKKDLLAQEAAKRILKDIRGKRQSQSLAQSSDNVAAEETPLQEKARQVEERTVSGVKKDSAPKGHQTRVYREATVKRRDCHALDPTSAPGLPVRARHPERVGVLPEQKKSPLSRLEESFEHLNLNRAEFLGSHSVRGPEQAPFSSSATVVEPISGRERTHVLHGHRRRSTGTNTPEIWGSNGFQESISASYSISSAKQEIVPGSTPPHAQSNTFPPNQNKSDTDIFCSTQRSTNDDHRTPSPPWKDHTTSGPDVQAWLAYDEGYSDSSALASAIFSKRILGDLKKHSLSPLDVINMVDSSWNRLSPEECRAFEKQAINTAKAIQETANAAAREIDMNRVAETAKRDIIDRLMIPFVGYHVFSYCFCNTR
ncbi:hypothetical protein B0J12DRAFT_26358 [Macrophomina phaseolina]|uniref:High mobility group HMG1/HMG2 n=1 Tax=Macrophomina phaseolina TaxID=35725 RepID=A0ABQ8GY88_9PEZI|nr:hypothetical protein B0J12DRAFT_26358 [Macrophomina phaseolina]